MRDPRFLLSFALLVAACASTPGGPALAPASTADAVVPSSEPSAIASSRPAPTTAPGHARLQPANGAYFGLNLDWANETVTEASERLGRSPAVWVQFVAFPLDDAGRADLDGFIEQVATVDGIGLLTLEPHDGLGAVTVAAARELATILAGYWDTAGVPTFVRFAHEMNGSWYPWAQQPIDYIAAYRRVAAAVHELAPASAMVWAPNQGSGYPFTGGRFAVGPGTDTIADLDTDGDGALTGADDPYAPYYPGDDAVDWVGMSLYHWGLEYPWGENELPVPGTFGELIRGAEIGAHAGIASTPDFYAVYAEDHDKPLAIIETAILFDPSATGTGPSEAQLKTAWFGEVFDPATRSIFPRLGMLNWFEWRKHEPEIGRVIDWRLGSDPELARSLLDGVAPGWLRFAGD